MNVQKDEDFSRDRVVQAVLHGTAFS